MKKSNKKAMSTKTLVMYALLTAIILLMACTPLGYLKTLGLEITFLTVPVIIGAIVMGPTAGAILGGIFGLTSYGQCFGILGLSPFGAELVGINPFLGFLVCVPTRILMGLLCGYIFKGLKKKFSPNIAVISISALSGALLNTFFFMTALILLFGKTDLIMSMRQNLNIIKFIIVFVGINGLVEAIVCTILGAAVAKPVYDIVVKKGIKS